MLLLTGGRAGLAGGQLGQFARDKSVLLVAGTGFLMRLSYFQRQLLLFGIL